MNRLTWKELMSGYYPEENVLDTDCFDKLGHLEDIEDELNCSLEIIFDALKKGVRYFNGQYYVNISKNTYDHLMLDWEKKAFIVLTEPMPYSGDTWNEYGIIYLKDYHKTWWVKDEVKECPLLLIKEVVKNGGYIKIS